MSKKKKIVGVALASVLMSGALVYYNFIDKAPSMGMGVGNMCLDFTVETYENVNSDFALDGNKATLGNQIGKVCVLNFWETWCQACVEELPEFNEVQVEYGDKVQIYAIAGVTSTQAEIAEYLNTGGWKVYDSESDWSTFSLTFAYMSYDACLEMGYNGILPRTIILDKSGLIVYEGDGKLSYERLKELIDSAL
ncbi:MAG: TlpA family protein disulfide reductase [Clostridia bacterium]|nr:TlpA family protein disulfide reductase [Clostridia bacterium]